ncbi:MAG: hypothetical protein V8T45_04120 [Oscillospiraceae bacterium]
MAFPRFEVDISYISKLSDEPNDVGTDALEAQELKERFDKAGNMIKDFINNTLLAGLNGGAASIGINEIPGVTDATDVQTALEVLKQQLDNTTTGTIPDGSLTTVKLADSSVTEAKIAADAVTNEKIKDGSITDAKISADKLSGSSLKDKTVATGNIADKAVTATQLADSAVETAKIKDAAVTSAKIAADAVQSSQIKAAAVTREKSWRLTLPCLLLKMWKFNLLRGKLMKPMPNIHLEPPLHLVA